MKTINPITGDDLILKDNAEFEVVNVGILLTPEKKVVNQTEQKTEQLKLSIVANGNEAEKPGVPFVWQRKEIHAVVDPIKWQKFVIPKNSISTNLDPESFLVDCDLKDSGAATFLATVTIRITDAKKLFDQKHKGFKDEYEEPVFYFPVVRADLWAVKAEKFENVKKHFPDKAIAQAYRTYDIASFSFEFSSSSKEPHSFDKENGLQPKISLKPAFPGDFESISADIGFNWKVVPVPASALIEKEIVKPGEMIIKPSKPCDYNVAVEVNLDFDQSTTIKLGDISATGQAVDLFSLIETRVDPASFTITIGETKTLKYIVSSLEQQPTSTLHRSTNALEDSPDNKIIYLLDKSYALTVEKVEWSDNQTPLPPPAKTVIEGNPYEFQANVSGYVKGQAKGFLKVSEIFKIENNKPRQSTVFHDNALWHTYIVLPTLQILVNNEPVGQQEYYLGQKIALSYKLGNTSGGNYKLKNPLWQISGPKVKEHDIFLGDGLPSELSDDELASENVTLFLYCTDEENFTKQIALEGRLLDKTIFATASIEIKHPIWSDPSPPEIPQPVLNHYTEGPDEVFYLGYKEGNEEYPIFEPTIANNTQIGYLIAGLHLVKNNHWRRVTVNGSGTEEIAQTYPSEEMWLDNKFPFLFLEAISASETKKLTSIFRDPPKVELDEAFPKIVSEVRADAEYLFFLMVKPSATNIPAENSIWTPIKAFKWKWTGHAVKDEEGKWKEKKPNSIVSQGFQAIHYYKIVSWQKTALHPLDEDQSDENHIIIKWEAKP